MRALVLAAGLGTRLLAETREKPKALVKIGGKTLLQRAIEKLIKEGITEMVVNVHHFSDQVISFLKEYDPGIPVLVSDETHLLLDTGGGLKRAAPMLKRDEPVLIYNVDVLTDLAFAPLIREHAESGALATLVVRNRSSMRYFKFNSRQRLVGWVNKKTGESKISVPGDFEQAKEMAFSGIQIVSPEIFHFFPAEDRFSLTSWYLDLAKDHLIRGYYDEEGFWMDVGKPGQLDEARKLTNLE